jgi:transcriptional regulator with XRE-family HTH domain
MSGGRSVTLEEAERIRAVLRNMRGSYATQRALADALGASQQVVSFVLAGGPPGLGLARQIAAKLGVSLDDLLSGERQPERSDRYTTRPAAMQAARLLKYDDDAIEHVETAHFDGAERFDEQDWLREVQRIQAILRKGGPVPYSAEPPRPNPPQPGAVSPPPTTTTRLAPPPSPLKPPGKKGK